MFEVFKTRAKNRRGFWSFSENPLEQFFGDAVVVGEEFAREAVRGPNAVDKRTTFVVRFNPAVKRRPSLQSREMPDPKLSSDPIPKLIQRDVALILLESNHLRAHCRSASSAAYLVGNWVRTWRKREWASAFRSGRPGAELAEQFVVDLEVFPAEVP